MITFYIGQKWERDKVDWGYQCKAGSLLGYEKNSSVPKDFSWYIGFYVLYDNDRLVRISNLWYDGQTSNWIAQRRFGIYYCLKRQTKLKSISWNSFSFIVTKSEHMDSSSKFKLIYDDKFKKFIYLIDGFIREGLIFNKLGGYYYGEYRFQYVFQNE